MGATNLIRKIKCMNPRRATINLPAQRMFSCTQMFTCCSEQKTTTRPRPQRSHSTKVGSLTCHPACATVLSSLDIVKRTSELWACRSQPRQVTGVACVANAAVFVMLDGRLRRAQLNVDVDRSLLHSAAPLEQMNCDGASAFTQVGVMRSCAVVLDGSSRLFTWGYHHE